MKGTRILNMRRAPCEKGSKMGMSRLTASSEKEDTEAMFPVLKKADWRRYSVKREGRMSEMVSALYAPLLGELSVFTIFFVSAPLPTDEEPSGAEVGGSD